MAILAEHVSPLADAALVTAVIHGDVQAFEALYRRHAAYVAGVVYRMLGNDGELDDVVQETFLIARRKLGQLVDRSRLRSWLIAIAVSRARRRFAAAKKRRAFEDEARLGTWTATRNPTLAAELYDALERLSDDLRVPWMLRSIEGLELAEVAKACHCSLATVKRRIALAEERLRRTLNEAG